MGRFLHIPAGCSGAGEGRVGVLLINLGTPEAADYFSLWRYLREFLSDRRVVELPGWVWKPVLYGIILTIRPFKSAVNYARIWDREKDASPLKIITQSQTEKLRQALGPGVLVEYGMRYGRSSVEQGVHALLGQGCDRIIVLPLYPQYAASTLGTANDALFRALLRLRRQPAVLTVTSFPRDPVYIRALAETIRRHLSRLDWTPEKILLSFHGVPKDMIEKGDSYQRECEETAQALREEMGKSSEEMILCFQSRFGPAEWLRPYTGQLARDLARQGIKTLAVATPGFFTDCLETLDEIGRELRCTFLEAGGGKFTRIPCLNDSREGLEVIESQVRKALKAF